MENLISKLESFTMSDLSGLDKESFIRFKTAIESIDCRLSGCKDYTDAIVLSNPVLDDFAISDSFKISRATFERLMIKDILFYSNIRVADIKKFLPSRLILRNACPRTEYKFSDVVWGYENGRLTFKGVLDGDVNVEATFKVNLW